MFGRKGLDVRAVAPVRMHPLGLRGLNRQPEAVSSIAFPLKSHIALSFASTILCAGLTLLMIGGLAHPGGVTLRRELHLNPMAADLFWGAWVLLSLWSTIGSGRMFLAALGPPRRVVIDEHAIHGPTGPFSRKVVRIPFSGITRAKLQEFGGAHFLTVESTGATLKVGSANFAEQDGFERMLNALHRYVKT